MITLYLGRHRPVYAVFLFAKNERENLSPAQTKALTRLVDAIKKQAKGSSS